MTRTRRSLKYIRLAAYLAGQPSAVRRLVLSVAEIERVVDLELPYGARFPSWWHNDGRRMHSKAWLTAGWTVGEMRPVEAQVVFLRAERAVV